MFKVVKLDDSFVVLPDGTFEKSTGSKYIGIPLAVFNGYAATKGGKLLKSSNGQFEVYPRKAVCLQVLTWHQNL